MRSERMAGKVMAKKINIDVYAKAEAGQRVFSVATANAAAVKQGLWRMGYRVSMRTDGNTTTIKIENK